MTIRNPFRSKPLRMQFEGAVQTFLARHQNFFNREGQPHRLNGFASPFWRGYFGEPDTCIPKGTFAYACYRAGQECGKEYPEKFWWDGLRRIK